MRRTLETALSNAGYAVDVAADGRHAELLTALHDYDVVLLDIMLPGLDGLSILRRLRETTRPTRVLLLTARDTVEDRVRGLDMGADDYLVKPFALEELLARVHALCRRGYPQPAPRLVIADLEIETRAREVFRAGVRIALTPREYLVLEYLARRMGEVVSRAEIEAHIYDERLDPMSNVVESAVSSLRKKLSGPNRAPLIHTRHGQGYILKESS